MYNMAKVLYEFFSSFGIPAFVEASIPDETETPYITYELKEPEPGEQISLAARVWYESTGYEEITRKVDEIKQAVLDGASIPCNDGSVWLWPDTHFCQFQPVEPHDRVVHYYEPTLKIAYLMFILGAYTS